MPAPEFIFLNDQAIKVTSLRPEDTGGVTLVVIARGGADRDRTLELLRDERLQVRLGQDAPARSMRATDTGVRSSGEGPQAIYRIETTLVPTSGEPATSADPVIERLDRIIALLIEIRDGLGSDLPR